MTAPPSFRVQSLDLNDCWSRKYKRRKFARKTKSGCSTCKDKKVKCDETQPVCIRCKRNKRLCSYSILRGSDPTKGSTSPRLLLDDGGFTPYQSISNISFFPPSAKNGTSSLELIQHFQSHWNRIFHIPHSHEVISLSKSSSLIRNTLLAVTACHLRHLAPNLVQHRLAEHFQQFIALHEYQAAIETPMDSLGQEGANAILLSGALLIILAFTLPSVNNSLNGNDELDARMSWIFSTSTHRLDWLSLQVGLKPLLFSLTPYLSQSLPFLDRIFLGDNGEENWSYRRAGLVSGKIPALWMHFFQLDIEGPGSANVSTLAPSVNTLSELRHVPPIQINIYKMLSFLGKITLEFRRLLYDRDPRAVWLFGYWLGLMSRFREVWWCKARVKRDYEGIKLYFRQLAVRYSSLIEANMWWEMVMQLETAGSM